MKYSTRLWALSTSAVILIGLSVNVAYAAQDAWVSGNLGVMGNILTYKGFTALASTTDPTAGTVTAKTFCLSKTASGIECLQNWPWFINISTQAIYANNAANKVGMGTATPDTELEVVNNEVGTSHGITNTQYSGSTNAAQFNLNKARGSKDAPAAVQAGDKLGNIRAKGWDGTQFDVGATITFRAEDNFTSAHNGTAIFFTTTAPGTSGGVEPPERMRITGSGKVGIGTPAPVATLDVNGFARLAPQSAAPVACDASHKGSIAITNTSANICVCNGTSWKLANTASACVW